jgi:hypothetical protein
LVFGSSPGQDRRSPFNHVVVIDPELVEFLTVLRGKLDADILRRAIFDLDDELPPGKYSLSRST